MATADVHYLRREDYSNHAALLCVQTKSTIEQPKLRFETNEFFLKSPAEMAESFSRWPEVGGDHARDRRALRGRDRARPAAAAPVPDAGRRGARRDCSGGSPREGLRRLYGDPPPAEAIERLEFELGVIGEMGFESYFLIVWDFVRYAKDNGIAVGPGRGSAAGSIVAYCLNITDLDPLANELLFERFLNPARKSMPDIDIDFSVRGRERVIRYVGREVRARVGGPDHHLRQDGPARRHPRRRPRARLRLRDRRPDREADPGAGDGPQPELRRVPQGRRGAQAAPTTPTPTRGGSSTSREGSRASSATTRSTPPPW